MFTGQLATIVDAIATFLMVVVAVLFLIRIFKKVIQAVNGSGEIKIGDIIKEVVYAIIVIAVLMIVQGLTTGGGVLWDLIKKLSNTSANVINQQGSNLLQ